MVTFRTALLLLAARLQAFWRGPAVDRYWLPRVHPVILSLIWFWLARAIAPSLWELAGLIPPGAPMLNPLTYAPPPPFCPDELRRKTLGNLRRLLRREARLAVRALELVIVSRVARPTPERVLAAHCLRMAQLYQQMRAWGGVALPLLIWDLHYLRQRRRRIAALLAFG